MFCFHAVVPNYNKLVMNIKPLEAVYYNEINSSLLPDWVQKSHRNTQQHLNMTSSLSLIWRSLFLRADFTFRPFINLDATETETKWWWKTRSMLAVLQVTAKMEIRKLAKPKGNWLQWNIKDTLVLFLRSKAYPRLQLPSYASTHTHTHTLRIALNMNRSPETQEKRLLFCVSSRKPVKKL